MATLEETQLALFEGIKDRAPGSNPENLANLATALQSAGGVVPGGPAEPAHAASTAILDALKAKADEEDQNPENLSELAYAFSILREPLSASELQKIAERGTTLIGNLIQEGVVEITTLRTDVKEFYDQASSASALAINASNKAQEYLSGAQTAATAAALSEVDAEAAATTATSQARDANTARVAAENARDRAKTSEDTARQHLTDTTTARDEVRANKADVNTAKDLTFTARDAAQSSAQAASTSEGKAKTSETNAGQSATNADTSAKAAKASETASKTSETNAKASEDAAGASKNAAKGSEDASKGSQTAAAASATAAASSAGAAKLSEDAAAGSAQAAAASATDANQAKDRSIAEAAKAVEASGFSALAADASEEAKDLAQAAASAAATSATSASGSKDAAASSAQAAARDAASILGAVDAAQKGATDADTSAKAAKSSQDAAASSASTAASDAARAEAARDDAEHLTDLGNYYTKAEIDARPVPDTSWDGITGKPETFPPSVHTHAQSEITGLVDTLAGKADLGSPTFTGTPRATGAMSLDDLGTTLVRASWVKGLLNDGVNRGSNWTVPTQSASDDTTKIANTSFVQREIGTRIASKADLVNGKLREDQLPAIAITETTVVASQAAMLALVAQTGDIAVRSDLNRTFALAASPASTLANWVELRTPTDAVLSVAGKTGAVSLVTEDVGGLDNALAAKANLASPVFTGSPQSVLYAPATRSTNIATTQFVHRVMETGADRPTFLPWTVPTPDLEATNQKQIINVEFFKTELEERLSNFQSGLDAAAVQTLIDDARVGDVVLLPASQIPAGRRILKLNGASLSRTAYAKLWAYAQASGNLANDQASKSPSQFGPGDGADTFTLPDYRGFFIRAWDDGRGIDAGRLFADIQESQNKAHSHTATTGGAGSHNHGGSTDTASSHSHSGSTDSSGSHNHSGSIGSSGLHNHTTSDALVTAGGSGPGFGTTGAAFAQNRYHPNTPIVSGGAHTHTLTINSGGSHSHGISLNSAGAHSHSLSTDTAANHTHTVAIADNGGSEARPENIVALYGIYY